MAAKKTLTTATKDTVLDAFQVVIDEARAEFEAQKAEEAAAWKKELARQKEEDNYNFTIMKRDREDAFKADMAKRTESLDERAVNVTAREVAVGDAEKTIADLQKQVDAIPVITAKAEATGMAKGAAEAKKEAEADARIKDAEYAAEKRILENGLKSVQAVVQTQAETIESLKAELAAANARVSEIATNAVTAAGQSKVTVNTAQGK